MDDRTLQALEFGKITARLAALAAFAPGRERAEALTPSADIGEVARRQALTDEARTLLERYGEPPQAGLADIRPALGKAARAALVEPAEFLDLARTAAAARRLARHLAEREREFPRLAALAGGIGDFRSLEEEIGHCITADATVADAASDDLRALRQRARTLHARVRERLEAMTQSAAVRPCLQEPIVTLRQDRYVLPVRQEYRGQVPGIVHDQSASGATLFIEPSPVVELNNELRRLALEIGREEERVLRRLTGLVAARGDAWVAMVEALAILDLVLAAGRLSREMEASAPELNDQGIVDLAKARHPLLRGRVIPVDLRLGEDFDTLVITGPNTGGKTVVLKTLGLLTLMAQAASMCRRRRGAGLAVFRQVCVDVGDEQSIEQNLSTFSSHLRNIVANVRRAGPGTLVLLDELGAGTDPAEGAALGMALLESLQAAGARTVVTTHYSELKGFAYSRERVENASVEFDVETLAPTYRLVIGVPGRSNAFEIATRLGLDPAIVRRARELVGREHHRVEAMLERLERERQGLEHDRRRAGRDAAEAERLRAEAERRAGTARAAGEEALRAARQEARTIVEAARREAADAVRRTRKAAEAAAAAAGGVGAGGAGVGQTAAALAEAEDARARLNRTRRRITEAGAGLAEFASNGEPVTTVRPGETLRVASLGLAGQVLSGPDNEGRVVLRVGAIKISVPLSDLARVLEQEKPVDGVQRQGPDPFKPSMVAKAMAVAPEIHLRRMTVDEALTKLDKYLDDAILVGIGEVRIVHGKGTGTLRQAVAEYLRKHPPGGGNSAWVVRGRAAPA